MIRTPSLAKTASNEAVNVASWSGLGALGGDLLTRYLQIARAAMARAIGYAEAHDLVGRNVATLVDAPKAQVGRPGGLSP